MTNTLIVVTGASSGIGQALASAAASSGATVATCSRSKASGIHLSVDLSDPASWPAFSEWVNVLVGDSEWQRVVFVHSAATINPIGFAGMTDAAAATSSVLLNAASPIVIGDAFLRALHSNPSATRRAVLLQISSGAGKRPFPGWSTYCAAKAAVDMWVKTVGAEQSLVNNGARVLSIGPGVVATGMQEQIRSSTKEQFPQVEDFQKLSDDGILASPQVVGSKLWEIANSLTWDSGAVMDIRDF